ncbi:MAG: fasciclin domain-containing protein [Bacteroidota bacterium]|nr:fasciclin domain-containing protein [Bacteroidota bacterium]
MKKNILFTAMTALMLLLFCQGLFVSCYDDGVNQKNYNTFVGQTIADYLESNKNYSEFTQILERAGMKGLMASYGSYTCLALTNTAIDTYISTYYNGSTVATLPDSVINAIAKSHLIDKRYLTSEMSTGYLATPNMYDRKVQVNIEKEFKSTLKDSTTVFLLNSSSRIIIPNDTVSNGVVHTIDRVLEQSNFALPDYMASLADSIGISLFVNALKATKLEESILPIEDKSATMAALLTQLAGKYQGDYKVPKSRKFGFTVFVESDQVFASIQDPKGGKPIFTNDRKADLKSLFNYAKSIYDEVYPEDKDQYDADYTNPKNPLNRFIAYHILKRNVSYSGLVTSGPWWSVNEGGDFNEYYETMCANTLLRLQMVSSKSNAIYLNRCDRSNNQLEGVPVLHGTGSSYSTLNGNFQLISRPLAYTPKVENMLKTERIRIDVSSLLSELTNNSIRQDNDLNLAGWYFPTGYFESVNYDNNCQASYVRWPYKAPSGWDDLAAFQSDLMFFSGDYDVTLRIPAVPAGQYEIRIGYNCNSLMSISQIYFGYNRKNMQPVGIPLDMNLIGSNPKVGMMMDNGLFDDINGNVENNTTGFVTLTENDKAMRNLGYMKGPNALYRVGKDRVTPGVKVVNNWWYLRRIITTQTLDNKPFYLRFRKVDERTGRILNLDFIEICPKSVYNGSEPESRN